MNSILSAIDGYKSYLIAAGVAVIVFLDLAEIVPLQDTIALLTLLGAGSIATIRHSIAKLEAKTQ